LPGGSCSQWPQEKLIDEKLLDLGNNIAHGKAQCPTIEDFEELYDETTALIRNLKDQISNAVVVNAYRSQAPN
jgi:hypothetical protein